jgi:hypothetical protein
MSLLTAYYTHLAGPITQAGPAHPPAAAHRRPDQTYAGGVWKNGRWANRKCPHRQRRERCVVCNGAGVCAHSKRRDKCIICSPGFFCHHRRPKRKCHECGGSAFCSHGMRNAQCPECTTTAFKLGTGKWCLVCVATRLSQRRVLLGVNVCAKCDDATPKRIETIVFELLEAAWCAAYGEILPPPTIKDSQLLGCGGNKRRPDLCWAWVDRIVHVEVDELAHNGRDMSCELAKLDETTFGVKGPQRPTLFLRFNPDNGELTKGVDQLCKALHRCLRTEAFVSDLDLCPLRANVAYISYPANSKHVLAASRATASIKVTSV